MARVSARHSALPRRTRKRIEGVKQLAALGARQIPGVGRLEDAKDAYEGTYKLATGKNPPELGHIRRAEREILAPGVAALEREERRRERQFDKGFGR